MWLWILAALFFLALAIGVYFWFTRSVVGTSCEPEIEDQCGKGALCDSVKKVCTAEEI